MIKKLWAKRFVRIFTYFLAVCILLFAFRGPILRSMGRFLVAQDAWEPTQLVVVLGGNSYERGLAAVDIAQQHPEVKFLATGGNRPMQILALDTSMFEAELTRHWMVKKGVDPSRIDILTSATLVKKPEKYRLFVKNTISPISPSSAAPIIYAALNGSFTIFLKKMGSPQNTTVRIPKDLHLILGGKMKKASSSPIMNT